MEQVSSFLENILVVEPEKGEIHDTPEVSHEARNEEETHGPEAAPPTPEQLTPDEPPAFSSFWYLEDDPRKASNQLTEKLMEKMLNVVINNQDHATASLDGRLAIHRTRPPFSVNLMTTNSTHFAQKISPVFETMDALILFFGWYHPGYTVGMLMVITHMILNPYLATAVPAVMLIKQYLVPSYLKLHPPDPSVVDGALWERNPVPHEGPALRKYEPPRPCSQLSREFLMNFTDLQNLMAMYVRLYDAVVGWGQHYFLFENRNLSAVVLAVLVASIVFDVAVLPCVVLLVFPHIPWRALAIVLVWTGVGLCHPVVRNKVLDRWQTEEARVARLNSTDRVEGFLMSFIDEQTPTDVERPVEIFELHRLSARQIWEPVGFTADYYTLNHPHRLLDAETQAAEPDPSPALPPLPGLKKRSSALRRAKGDTGSAEGDRRGSQADDDEAAVLTDTNEDDSVADDSLAARESKEEEGSVLPIAHKDTLGEIQPPANWKFAGAWRIDLDPHVWVNQNCIMDLVSVDTDEKWVYDFADHGETPDAQMYRRRRWTRPCRRERGSPAVAAVAPSAKSSEWLSKTLSLA